MECLECLSWLYVWILSLYLVNNQLIDINECSYLVTIVLILVIVCGLI